MRQWLGYDDDQVVIGYLGRLIRSKGGLSLLHVASRLVSQHPEVRFLMVGDGPLRPEVERRIRSQGLAGHVTLAGFVPWWETPDYLNAMDVFAFPSHTEAFGLALLEAMACGLPAVARATAGAAEVLRVPGSGYLVHSDEELYRRLARLVQDVDLRRRMGAEARRHVERDYYWSAVAQETEAVYRQVLAEPPTRAEELAPVQDTQHRQATVD